jgi:hypothetical protein
MRKMDIIDKLLKEINSKYGFRIISRASDIIKRTNTIDELRTVWLYEFDEFKNSHPELDYINLTNEFEKYFNAKHLQFEGGVKIWKL